VLVAFSCLCSNAFAVAGTGFDDGTGSDDGEDRRRFLPVIGSSGAGRRRCPQSSAVASGPISWQRSDKCRLRAAVPLGASTARRADDEMPLVVAALVAVDRYGRRLVLMRAVVCSSVIVAFRGRGSGAFGVRRWIWRTDPCRIGGAAAHRGLGFGGRSHPSLG
jgi:hypothetical protein